MSNTGIVSNRVESDQMFIPADVLCVLGDTWGLCWLHDLTMQRGQSVYNDLIAEQSLQTTEASIYLK